MQGAKSYQGQPTNAMYPGARDYRAMDANSKVKTAQNQLDTEKQKLIDTLDVMIEERSNSTTVALETTDNLTFENVSLKDKLEKTKTENPFFKFFSCCFGCFK